MSIIARIDQQVTLTPGFTDAKGNPVAAADLGSTPVWTVSDPALATLTVAEDGSSAVVASTGVLGTVQVNMVVDADPDEDVEEIVGTLDIEYKAGKATFVTLSSALSDLPATPPPEPTEPPAVPAA